MSAHLRASRMIRLMTIFLIVFNCQFLKTVQSSSTGNPDGNKRGSSEENSDVRQALLQELSGSHLRFSASIDPPWFTVIRRTNNVTNNETDVIYGGWMIDAVDYMAQTLNITYHFVETREDENREKGLREGAISLLDRKEVDVVTKTFILNPAHCARVDCSFILYGAPFQLLVPWPKQESQITAAVRPFQYQIWILLPISAIFVSFSLILIQKYYKRRGQQGETSTSYKLFIYILTGEGDFGGWNQLSFRFVQGAWCFASAILIYAYCSTIISYLVAPKLMPVSKTFQDLASGSPQKLKVLTEKNNAFALFCLRPDAPEPFKSIGDLLRRYPESLFVDTEKDKGFELLLTGEYAYPALQSRVTEYRYKAFQKFKDCRFTVSNPNMDRVSYLVWGFRKKWRYTDAVNQKMMRLAESGLVDYWRKKVTPRTERCNPEIRKDGDDGRKILTLADLSGPFILLISGCTVSFFVFLIERLCYRYCTLTIGGGN